MTSDPIGLDGGLNTFAYAFSNSIRYVDPFGLDVWVGGEGGAFAAFGLGVSSGVSHIVNLDSGEQCTLSISCGRIGFGGGIAAGTKGVASAFGPSCGKNLEGWSFYLSGDVVLPGAPGGSGNIGGGSSAGIGADVGPSAGAALFFGADICYASVIQCSGTPTECTGCSGIPEPVPVPDNFS